MEKGIQLGAENIQEVGSLTENFLISSSSTSRHEASGAFYRIEISLFTAEVDAQRWGRRTKSLVFQNPLECD